MRILPTRATLVYDEEIVLRLLHKGHEGKSQTEGDNPADVADLQHKCRRIS